LCEVHKQAQGPDPHPVPERYLEEARKAKVKLESLCQAISASVPQHLGLIEPPKKRDGESTPVSTPISSVEVRQTPSPPTSPSGLSSLKYDVDGRKKPRERGSGHCGPTVLNLTRAQNPEEETQRVMLLASAPNSMVLPLYMVGMSSVCTDEMRTYVIERLHSIQAETGLKQAKAAADIIEEYDASKERLEFRLKSPHEASAYGYTRYGRPYKAEEDEDMDVPV
jgi:hypothetical protein